MPGAPGMDPPQPGNRGGAAAMDGRVGAEILVDHAA